jgi:hypothetical protein
MTRLGTVDVAVKEIVSCVPKGSVTTLFVAL